MDLKCGLLELDSSVRPRWFQQGGHVAGSAWGQQDATRTLLESTILLLLRIV